MVFHKPRPALRTSRANRLTKSANAMHKTLGNQNNSRLTGPFIAINSLFLQVVIAPANLLAAGVADFRLLPLGGTDGHRKELPHHFFNRQSAISPPRRGNEKLVFGLRLRSALFNCPLSPDTRHLFFCPLTRVSSVTAFPAPP